jgi:hypothetical protein
MTKEATERPARRVVDWNVFFKWVLVLLVLGLAIYLNAPQAEPVRQPQA